MESAYDQPGTSIDLIEPQSICQMSLHARITNVTEIAGNIDQSRSCLNELASAANLPRGWLLPVIGLEVQRGIMLFVRTGRE